MENFNKCLQDILRDMKVELGDEFDKNFRRGSFFSGARWAKSKRPNAKTTLIDSGNLRRSIKGEVQGNVLRFSLSLPYAAIHNMGGTIKVTAKMKRYFWAKYIEATGKVSKTKSGKKSGSQRNRHLSAKAEYYKSLALMKVGKTIVIPQRQFLGYHPDLDKPINEIVQNRMEDYLQNNLPKSPDK